MTHGSPASPTLPDGIATIHVVTPCWNAAATIDETIRSILGQQGAFRLRYHIQDGGSDDGTVERIKSFEGALASGATKIGCLEVVLTWDSAPDGGMYDAIAKGFARLAAPAGDFMTWLNADDLLLPGSLDRVARLATSRPDVAWVGGARHLVDEAGRLIEHDPDTPFPREIIAQGLCDGIHWQFVRQEGLFWRASLYAAAGGLDIGLSRAGDWDLWRRMAAYAPRHALPVALGAFRRRHGQISADLTPYFAEIDAKVPRPVRARLARLLRDKLPTLEAPKLADPLGGVPQVNEPAQAAAETWRLTHFPDTPWPRITIVTPSFNQGIFLDACMRSILDQGYPNLEYIVLDGGSTDNSVTVIRSHAKELTHWRSGPDGGQYRAVEEGLALGTGEIMAWLNADDLYHDFCLFKVAMLFLSHPDVDWLIGRPTVANAEGNICYRQRDLAWSRSKILSAKGALDEEFMGQDAVFWRRSLWARAGARLDHRFGLAADYELWVRFARHAALHTVRDELSSFRYHGDQRSLAAKAGYHREMAAVIEAELSRLRRMPATTPLDQAPPFLSLDYAAVFPPAATGTLSPRHGESPGASVGPAGLEALEAELRLLQRTLANPLSLRVDFQKDDAGLHQLSGGLPASVRYVFFDCFDTLLYRLSDEPTRLFVEVGRRLLRAGLLAAHVSPGEFRVLRQVAETRAREDAWSVRRTRECSIEEIYARLAPVVGDPGRAVEAEIETERDFCYLNPNIASLIATLHRSGKRVAVLSDNYLSSAQLASVLRACGLDLGLFDLILTSRDVGVTKTEGRLFQAALKKLRITPDQAVHIGDSREADVRGAALAKMTGLHYPRRDNAIEAVFQRERTLADTDGQAASLGSLRVLARRNGATYAQPWRGYYQDGAFLLGPPLARFADWAVEQCRRENVTRVLVLMREGHTLLPLLRQSSRAAGFPLDLALFYASRHSVNMASLNDITPEMLFEKIHKHTTVSARVLIETLGLNPDLIKEIDPATMDSVLNEAERFTLATLLAGHPVYNPTLKALALQARQAFLGYALPLLEGHERVAMVDIGFRGTIQHSFDNLLRLENHPARTMGLYFCTQAAAAQKVIDGSDIRSYLGGLGADQHLMRVLFTHPEILEQSVNATCGSTLGYVQESDGSYRPQLDAAHLPFEQLYKRHLIQQGIHEFQRLWLECVTSRRKSGGRPVLDAACLEEIDREVIAILRRLWSFPTPEEAGRLGSLFHDDNNGTDTGGIICSDPCRAAFREGGLEKLYNSNAYWPQGIIGLESPGLIEHIFTLKHRLELP